MTNALRESDGGGGRARPGCPPQRGMEYCLRCLPHHGVGSSVQPHPRFSRSDRARQGNGKREQRSRLLTSSGAACVKTELTVVMAWTRPSHPEPIIPVDRRLLLGDEPT